MEWADEFDGVEEWATYGWARLSDTMEEKQEFFRLTINKDPVGDAEYLGDRSLVCFLLKEGNTKYLFFSVYNYGFEIDLDSTNEYFKVEVSDDVQNWFYTYTAYSVKLQTAILYLYIGAEGSETEISH
jgi:hypothetical protein